MLVSRAELEKEWDISRVSDAVRNRGIYEGEFWPVIVYDGWASEGNADEVFYSGNAETAVFFVNEEERITYELGDDAYAVTVHESVVGVRFSIWTEAAFEMLAEEMEWS